MEWTPISEISQDRERVMVIGIVLDVVENCIMINDGTGKARVFTDEASRYSPKTPILVIGSPKRADHEAKEIDAEVIVDLSGIDLKHLNEVRNLRGEVERIKRRILGGMSDVR